MNPDHTPETTVEPTNDSHYPISRATLEEWNETLVTHHDQYNVITSKIEYSTYRGILACLVIRGGWQATYDELNEYTSCTRRKTRNAVYTLRDADVLHIEQTRPVMVSFASRGAFIAAEHVLSAID